MLFLRLSAYSYALFDCAYDCQRAPMMFMLSLSMAAHDDDGNSDGRQEGAARLLWLLLLMLFHETVENASVAMA